jgi:hypothetical protein
VGAGEIAYLLGDLPNELVLRIGGDHRSRVLKGAPEGGGYPTATLRGPRADRFAAADPVLDRVAVARRPSEPSGVLDTHEDDADAIASGSRKLGSAMERHCRSLREASPTFAAMYERLADRGLAPRILAVSAEVPCTVRHPRLADWLNGVGFTWPTKE